MFKHFTHEGGIASPLIAHWPKGIQASLNGSLNASPSHLIDVMPTLLQIANAEYPTRYRDTDVLPFAGISLLPTFAGKKLARSVPIFFEHEGNRAVRAGKWKAVSRLGSDWELYDMEKDRTETTNIANKNKQRVESMSLAYDKWASSNFVDLWRQNDVRDDAGNPMKASSKEGKGE